MKYEQIDIKANFHSAVHKPRNDPTQKNTRFTRSNQNRKIAREKEQRGRLEYYERQVDNDGAV